MGNAAFIAFETTVGTVFIRVFSTVDTEIIYFDSKVGTVVSVIVESTHPSLRDAAGVATTVGTVEVAEASSSFQFSGHTVGVT